ncbi:hypothetical protein EJ05DRAFT_179072 [Pseudovirgaria hyperparasitica]|uniref:Uncharacterized protein n=1 Tax=Pseudovirgaria hyperparasitica TaxID=470096 RepID=A0A6A6WFM7_9PEZI|nr:uncharacterized protein EJ05DRAFT_179072 [Pseudovirgaria hyperparasitica]KAF2761628.1 hypothetical protein EJ05DRAFT_179072 [Pseudovirgaria hyperparasitica]
MSSFATNTELSMVLPPGCAVLRCPTDLLGTNGEDTIASYNTSTTLHLGSLQYGQSRDFIFRYAQRPTQGSIQIKLRYTSCLSHNGSPQELIVTYDLSKLEPATETEEYYHDYRGRLCALIQDICRPSASPWHVEEEMLHLVDIRKRRAQLARLIESRNHSDPDNQSILLDVKDGSQLWEAIETSINVATERGIEQELEYKRWGAHFMRSMLFAHAMQRRNTFKDAGPLRYGIRSPLFLDCKQEFDTFYGRYKGPGKLKFMSELNQLDRSCWAGQCTIETEKRGAIPTSSLEVGDRVRTQAGFREVKGIVPTPVEKIKIRRYRNSGLLITPWHPIAYFGEQSQSKWIFPHEDSGCEIDAYTGVIYSLLLEEDGEPSAHNALVQGMWCVTLGHGVIKDEADVRAHKYWGSYGEILRTKCHHLLTSDGTTIMNPQVSSNASGTC